MAGSTYLVGVTSGEVASRGRGYIESFHEGFQPFAAYRASALPRAAGLAGVGFADGRFGFATLTRGRDAFPDVRGGGVTCMIGCAARAGAVAARSACVGARRQMRAPSIPIQMKPVEGAGVVPPLCPFFILF